MSTKKRSDGDGSVFQRSSDQKWVAQISLGRNHLGRRVRRTRTAKTQREASRLLREMQAEFASGPLLAEDHVTVADWCRQWCETIAPHRVSAATVSDYRYSLEHYLFPLIGSVELRNLSPSHYAEAQQRLLESGLAPSTVRHARRPLSVCLNYAVQTGRLRLNPVSVVPQPRMDTGSSPTRSRWLDHAESQKLIARASEESPLMFGVVVLGLCRGLRRGEILGLRWEDVDPDRSVIRIGRRLREERMLARDGGHVVVLRPGPPKTKTSNREVPVDAVVGEALARLRTDEARRRLAAGPDWNPTGYIFTNAVGAPLWPSNVYRAFKSFLVRNDLADVSLHDLRRSFANLAIQADARLEQVSEALGHSSVEVTKSVYIGSAPSLARRAFEQFDEFFGQDPPSAETRRSTGEPW